MANFDMKNNIKVANALDIAAISTNTTTVGDELDAKGYEALTFVIQSGTLTDGTYTPVVYGGTTSGSLSALADSELIGTEADAAFAATNDNTVKTIGVKVGANRYFRIDLVSAGTTSGGTIGASAILGAPQVAPAV